MPSHQTGTGTQRAACDRTDPSPSLWPVRAARAVGQKGLSPAARRPASKTAAATREGCSFRRLASHTAPGNSSKADPAAGHRPSGPAKSAPRRSIKSFRTLSAEMEEVSPCRRVRTVAAVEATSPCCRPATVSMDSRDADRSPAAINNPPKG